MTGQEALKETAAKLKAEVEAEKIKEKNSKENAQSELALVKEKREHALVEAGITDELMAFMQENAALGAEDLNDIATMPVLRPHTSNSTTELFDGSTPNIGQLYYSATRQAFDSAIVHVLAVKKAELEKYQKPGEYQKNYLIAGVFAEGELKGEPFLLYAKGMSYKYVWEMQEQALPFTKRKDFKIPRFMMKYKLWSTDLEKGDIGAPQPVIKWQLLINEDLGIPELQTSTNFVVFLKNSVESAEYALDQMIKNKSNQSEQDITPENQERFNRVAQPETQDSEDYDPEEDVADDVPF